METLNKAIEGADAFKKMMEKTTQSKQGAPAENRKQRRAREKAERRAKKATV